jgi:hypothetical protein
MSQPQEPLNSNPDAETIPSTPFRIIEKHPATVALVVGLLAAASPVLEKWASSSPRDQQRAADMPAEEVRRTEASTVPLPPEISGLIETLKRERAQSQLQLLEALKRIRILEQEVMQDYTRRERPSDRYTYNEERALGNFPHWAPTTSPPDHVTEPARPTSTPGILTAANREYLRNFSIGALGSLLLIFMVRLLGRAFQFFDERRRRSGA